jgi:hypothetical protein
VRSVVGFQSASSGVDPNLNESQGLCGIKVVFAVLDPTARSLTMCVCVFEREREREREKRVNLSHWYKVGCHIIHHELDGATPQSLR